MKSTSPRESTAPIECFSGYIPAGKSGFRRQLPSFQLLYCFANPSDARRVRPIRSPLGRTESALVRGLSCRIGRLHNCPYRRLTAPNEDPRATQRRVPTGPDDEERLNADIVELARQYGRYGYRKIAEMLRTIAGWVVNDKRVERIWRREGLKVPAKQPKRSRLWLADGSCLRLRAERPNHVWSYDFVEDRTHEGRKYRMLNIIDEFTHECLAIRIDRKLKSVDVIDVLSDLFILRGVPERLRSDNGPEFVAKAVQDWIAAVGAKAACIALGSPWENGFIESFNARLQEEL